MSGSTAKKYRKTAKKVMITEHEKIIMSYLDGYCSMSKRSRRRFARLIIKGINPLRLGEIEKKFFKEKLTGFFRRSK